MINENQNEHQLNGNTPKQDSESYAIAACRQEIKKLTELGMPVIHENESLRDQLTQVADQLTNMLRWERRYTEAIELQTKLMPYLPEDKVSLLVMVATMKIESGNKTEGFKELQQIAERDPNNIWGWIALGSGYLWAGHPLEAEANLLKAASLETAESTDRAVAYQQLFKLYGTQKYVEDAVQAWEHSVSLDPTLETTVSDLLRMLIYWYYFDAAESFLVREQSDLRHKFYQSLIDFKRFPASSRRSWEWVMELDPATLCEGHDEFAEACIRLVQPRLALEAIEPLIDQGDLSPRRLVLAGFAWAQQRMIDRAEWALSLALRLGDLETPRGTRRSVGGSRVLDAESRILYAEIIIDTDIREEVDRYFMPVVKYD